MVGFGDSPYGTSFYGGADTTLVVERAFSINPNTVVVVFSTDLEQAQATFDTANYVIPGLTVQSVLPDPLSYIVRLIVDTMADVTYQVSVFNVRSSYLDTISGLGRSASFAGWPSDPKLTARAISSNTVQVLFAQPMAVSAEISLPSFYVLTDDQGNVVNISSAVPNSVSDILRVRLNLAAPLIPGKAYGLHVFDGLLTSEGAPLPPTDTTVIWYQPKTKVSVPMSRFTGEVRATAPLDRRPSEVLALQESLSITIDPYRNLGNTQTTFTDSFEDRGSSPLSLSTIVNSDVPVVTAGETFSQSTRLQTKLQPSDPARPNYRSAYTFSLGERVQVDYASADDLTHGYAVDVEEKLFFEERFGAERPRIFIGLESLKISEAIRVLPEVQEGLDPSTTALFGVPNGQVFFSPALLPSLTTPSSISVDEVQVCTRAYDVYKFPEEIDPLPLYTHGGGLVPSFGSVLSPGFVLFSNFARLTGMQTNLTSTPKDDVPRPVDVGASIVLKQVYDPNRFSLLNNPAWHLFDNSGRPFITADNLSPVGPVVVGPSIQFANPAEDFKVVEVLTSSAGHSIFVTESLTISEDTHQFPGFNQVLVSLSATLTLSEGLAVVP